MNKSLALASVLIASSVLTVTAPEAMASTPSVINIWEAEEFKSNDHAFTFQGLKSLGLTSDRDFQFETPGIFTEYDDGTATLTGIIVNQQRAEEQWQVDLTFNLISDYNGGTKNGGVKNLHSQNGYSDKTSFAHDNWTFYEIDREGSFLTGLGAYEGSSLQFFNRAFNQSNYGDFVASGQDAKVVGQLGEGANDKTKDIGLSYWYGYTGNVVYEKSNGDILTYTLDETTNKNKSKSDININLTKVQSSNTAGTPEPFTILGSISALGIGGLFKKKFSKNSSKKSDRV